MKSYDGINDDVPHTVTFTVKNEVDCQCSKCGKDIMSFDNKWIDEHIAVDKAGKTYVKERKVFCQKCR